MAHVAIALGVTVHVLLNKRNIGTSISWMGIAWLSPFVGGALYYAFGVNRVKRRARRLRRERSHMFLVDEVAPDAPEAGPLTPLEYAIGRLTGLSAETGNKVSPLRNGDSAYPAMLAAIDAAEKSVGIASYIFRDDEAGMPFIEALIRAHRRGVAVRVLIDGIGGGYFRSATYERLLEAGVPVDRFLHSYVPWKTPFLNLRNHRKLLVVDGRIAFTGGINIGRENVLALQAPHPVRDTHFRLEGPVVEQLTEAFADDWLYETGEKLLDEAWFPELAPCGDAIARVIPSGPDEDLEQIEFAILHAISCARRSVRVVTPYFLPPDMLTTALGLAAMRGVTVDIIVPERSNHIVLDWARRVPLRNLCEAGCNVWLMPGPFDHSKLMTIDDAWSLIGSANWDTRSFRLNFELNVEIQNEAFARSLMEAVPKGRPLTKAEIDGDPLPFRLRNNAARLLQPYL
ncbi:phospholipase D-like domain-containing protein [Reyranella sp.]|uniref:phospholipase D-like domain-containing protein n=1 Tax=Reyranella sp. TaxID=1929291 RepID=UPI0025E02CCB|nr:phospholipase D-like domain-containing protein [Reyranella sp.]